MTWKEFKDAVEALGMQDGWELDWIDWADGPEPPRLDVFNNGEATTNPDFRHTIS